jgi:hypothetical protein
MTNLVEKDQSWMPCFDVVMFHNANVHGHDLEIKMWPQDVYVLGVNKILGTNLTTLGDCFLIVEKESENAYHDDVKYYNWLWNTVN